MFTHSSRWWTAYGADRIEVMLRWAGGITNEHHYAYYDTNKEELVFIRQPTSEEIIERTRPEVFRDAQIFTEEKTRILRGGTEHDRLRSGSDDEGTIREEPPSGD